MATKGRHLCYLIISLGLLVLVVAVYAFRGPILEQWYLWRLKSEEGYLDQLLSGELSNEQLQVIHKYFATVPEVLERYIDRLGSGDESERAEALLELKKMEIIIDGGPLEEKWDYVSAVIYPGEELKNRAILRIHDWPTYRGGAIVPPKAVGIKVGSTVVVNSETFFVLSVSSDSIIYTDESQSKLYRLPNEKGEISYIKRMVNSRQATAAALKKIQGE